MIVEVNSKLVAMYKEHSKNPNYALSFILNSMDPDTCIEGIALVDGFTIPGESTGIEIDEKNARAIKSIFGAADSATVTKLLWVAMLFPEI